MGLGQDVYHLLTVAGFRNHPQYHVTVSIWRIIPLIQLTTMSSSYHVTVSIPCIWGEFPQLYMGYCTNRGLAN